MYIRRLAEENVKNCLNTEKILLILGARQVGKTTLIKHILEGKNAEFFNFDVLVDKDRFAALASLPPIEALGRIKNPDFLVIDEAHRMSDIGRIVKGWYDVGAPVKIIMLGSSSFELLNQSAESLVGRNEKIFLSPMTFKELIASRSWYVNGLSWQTVNERFASQAQSALSSVLVFGNYPEVIVSPNKEEILLNLAGDYLLKDVLQVGLVKNSELIKRLLMLIAHQVGSEVSINELSRGLGISRVTVEHYLDILEQTYVIFRLPAFSTNARKEIVKSKKIYFYDTGIRNAVLKEFSVNATRSDIGQLWENWVIAEKAKENLLSGNKSDFYFWRSRAGSEIDLIEKRGGELFAFEIKWKKQSIQTRAFRDMYNVKVKLLNSENPFDI